MTRLAAAQLMTVVTLTGVDEQTRLFDVIELSERFPFVEWGVLYSPNRAGKEGRYPGVDNAFHILRELREHGVSTAVHLCGGGVIGALDGRDANALALAELGGRVQLNFNQARKALDLDTVDAFANRLGKPVITQHNKANETVHLHLTSPFHQVLFDASGGRGTRPDHWPAVLPGIRCGFAGGLGPENVASEIDRIADASHGYPFWIDMESSLRDREDRFDLGVCEEVLTAVEHWRTR